MEGTNARPVEEEGAQRKRKAIVKFIREFLLFSVGSLAETFRIWRAVIVDWGNFLRTFMTRWRPKLSAGRGEGAVRSLLGEGEKEWFIK